MLPAFDAHGIERLPLCGVQVKAEFPNMLMIDYTLPTAVNGAAACHRPSCYDTSLVGPCMLLRRSP